MTSKWDTLLSKFRTLGGVADNVCQKEGENGRGIFPINAKHKSKIFTPSNLIIKKDDIYLNSKGYKLLLLRSNNPSSYQYQEYYIKLEEIDDQILEALKDENLYQSCKEDQKRLDKIITEESETYFKFLQTTGKTIIDADTFYENISIQRILSISISVLTTVPLFFL